VGRGGCRFGVGGGGGGGGGRGIPQEQLFAKYRVTLRFIYDNLMKFLWNLCLEVAYILLAFRCINADTQVCSII